MSEKYLKALSRIKEIKGCDWCQYAMTTEICWKCLDGSEFQPQTLLQDVKEIILELIKNE